MKIAFIREEKKGHPWVDLYNTETKQSFPLSRFNSPGRDYKAQCIEAEYYCKNINLVLGNLTVDQV